VRGRQARRQNEVNGRTAGSAHLSACAQGARRAASGAAPHATFHGQHPLTPPPTCKAAQERAQSLKATTQATAPVGKRGHTHSRRHSAQSHNSGNCSCEQGTHTHTQEAERPGHNLGNCSCEQGRHTHQRERQMSTHPGARPRGRRGGTSPSAGAEGTPPATAAGCLLTYMCVCARVQQQSSGRRGLHRDSY
jgi:hypothetical protein